MGSGAAPREPQPWQDHARLAGVVAGWRRRWCGRRLFAATAGATWVRLLLAGDAKDGVLLADVPGARVVAATAGRLPEPLREALPPRRQHPLRTQLRDARLERLGALPDDRVVAFGLTAADGTPRVLLHRLFGVRGDTVLLDADGRVLWSRYRPPHDRLAQLPPEATWSYGAPAADDVSAAAIDHLTDRLAARLAADRATALGRRLRAAERLTANLARDLAAAGSGDEHRRRAEALAARLHEVAPGAASIETEDPRSGEPLVIPLDPALSAAANLEAAFRRARKADKGRDVIAVRLRQAQETVAALAAAAAGADDLPAAPALTRLAAALAWRDATDALLPAAGPGRRAHSADEPARPFRRYRIEDRWEVWIGRNNRENDELTHKASHPRDIWLHAQGVSGSHVILRTGGHPERVPRRVIALAAALAALHSKARHAGLVPVVWTERRYVRKPRKAAAGTAVCLREQSLFAAPGVPRGAVAC